MLYGRRFIFLFFLLGGSFFFLFLMFMIGTVKRECGGGVGAKWFYYDRNGLFDGGKVYVLDNIYERTNDWNIKFRVIIFAFVFFYFCALWLFSPGSQELYRTRTYIYLFG